MNELADIPVPEVLDPGRPLRPHGTEVVEDDRPEAVVLRQALDQSCAYGQQLWAELNRMRAYLLEILPPVLPDRRSRRADASPDGPDDDARWQSWMDSFVAVTSALCGPGRRRRFWPREGPPGSAVATPVVRWQISGRWAHHLLV